MHVSHAVFSLTSHALEVYVACMVSGRALPRGVLQEAKGRIVNEEKSLRCQLEREGIPVSGLL